MNLSKKITTLRENNQLTIDEILKLSFPVPNDPSEMATYLDTLLELIPEHLLWARNMAPDVNHTPPDLMNAFVQVSVNHMKNGYAKYLVRLYDIFVIVDALSETYFPEFNSFFGSNYLQERHLTDQYIPYEYIVFLRQKNYRHNFVTRYLRGVDVHSYLTTPYVFVSKEYDDGRKKTIRNLPLDTFSRMSIPVEYLEGLEYNPTNLVHGVRYITQPFADGSQSTPLDVHPELKRLEDPFLFVVKGPISFVEFLVKNNTEVLLMGDEHSNMNTDCSLYPLVPQMELIDVVDEYINSPMISNQDSTCSVHFFIEAWHNDTKDSFQLCYLTDLRQRYPHCFAFNQHRRALWTSGLHAVQTVNDLVIWNKCIRQYSNKVFFHYADYRSEHPLRYIPEYLKLQLTENHLNRLKEIINHVLSEKMWLEIVFIHRKCVESDSTLGEIIQLNTVSKVVRALAQSKYKDRIIEFMHSEIRLIEDTTYYESVSNKFTYFFSLYMDIGLLCRLEKQVDTSGRCKVIIYAGDRHIQRYYRYMQNYWGIVEHYVNHPRYSLSRCIKISSPLHPLPVVNSKRICSEPLDTLESVMDMLGRDNISSECLDKVMAALYYKDATQTIRPRPLFFDVLKLCENNIDGVCKTNEAKLLILLGVESTDDVKMEYY